MTAAATPPKKNGGARPGAGRKPSDDPPRVYSIKVPGSWVPALRAIPQDTIRRALKRLLSRH
jgi:hypothetical protein